MKNEKEIFSCGYCGAPCDKDGNHLPEIPENYNPNDYEHVACHDCMIREQTIERNRWHQVTREMALDAGDPGLEGQWIRW